MIIYSDLIPPKINFFSHLNEKKNQEEAFNIIIQIFQKVNSFNFYLIKNISFIVYIK